MLRYSLRYAGMLFGLQAVFGALVFLLSDWFWLALPVTLLFCGLVWAAGRSFTAGAPGPHRAAAWLTATAAQLPGLQGSLRFLTDRWGPSEYDGITDLQDFAMQTWHTVLLPLLTAIPVGLVEGYYARYYIALLLLSPLLVMLFAAAALWSRRSPAPE